MGERRPPRDRTDRRNRPDRGDGRGVSDLIGFVLVFGLVLSTIGLVFTTGVGGLQDVRNAERVNNAERAFAVLADNFADIYGRNAPSRKTEIKLAEAQLQFGEPTELNVTVQDITTGGNVTVFQTQTTPIIYTAQQEGQSELVYEGGAIVRSDRGNAIFLRDPPFLLAEERTVIQYVAVSSSGSTQSVGGSSTVLVRGVGQSQNVLVNDTDNDVRVTFTIETSDDRAEAWQAYVNEQVDWASADWEDGDETPCDDADTTSLGGGRTRVVCTFEPKEFYLSSSGIAVEFS